MDKIIELFKGDNLAPALIVTVAAFLLGVLFELAVGAIFRKGRGQERMQRPVRRDMLRPSRPHPAPADGSIEVYVGNLNYEMTDDMLRKEFEAYGKVNSARVITNRFNGRSKGFGFVHMPNMAEVEAAIKGLSDKEVLGRKLKCNVARNA